MPDAGLSHSPEAMRLRALETLAALVGGTFWEKMRIEAAARILVTARRVAVLAEGDGLEGPAPEGSILALALRWDAPAMTVNEFAEIVAVLAEAVRSGQSRVPDAEKSRLLHRL